MGKFMAVPCDKMMVPQIFLSGVEVDEIPYDLECVISENVNNKKREYNRV